MNEISEATILEKLNSAEGDWKWVEFPPDKIPEGHKVRSISGVVADTTWLLVEFEIPGQDVAYDGTLTLPPFTFVHLPPNAAQAAFLKGAAWLEKQKTAV